MTDEKKQDRQPPRLSPLQLLAVLLLLVTAAAAVFAFSDAGERYKDRFRRWLLYGSVQEENRYTYSADNNHLFGQAGDYLAVLSQNSLQLLRSDGTAQLDRNVNFSYPALTTGGGLAAAWGVGGTSLVVADGDSLPTELDEGENLISVRLNQNGWLAVTSEKNEYKGAVTVYNRKQEKVFSFQSASFLLDAIVSRDGRRMLAVALGQEGGLFVSRFILYDLDKEEPAATGTLSEGLVLDLAERAQGYTVAADQMLAFLDKDGGLTGTYPYEDAYLQAYSLGGRDFGALLLGRYRAGVVGRLVTVDETGRQLGSLEVSREVLDISAAGDYVAVLYSGELVIYRKDLSVYASTRDTALAGRVLLAEDGSALVVSADSAWRFLP